jgi:hypothetical protein
MGHVDGCCDVHRVVRVHGLYDDEVHEENGDADDGVAQGTGGVNDGSLEECGGGWASVMKDHQREVVEDERVPRVPEVGVLCGHLYHDREAHEVHEEDHVFCRGEPKDPRTPDPRKD